MTAGVDGDFKQRQEDVLQHLLEVGQLLLGVVHITVESGDKTWTSVIIKV